MKTFIIRSVIFFFIAAVVVIAVFFFLHTYSIDEVATPEAFREATTTVLTEVAEKTSRTGEEAGDVVASVPEEGVPLSSLPLTESHKKALAAVHIDVDTFVLTKEMVTCAGEKIGEDRIAEIIAGNSPSILEITKLIPCLGA